MPCTKHMAHQISPHWWHKGLCLSWLTWPPPRLMGTKSPKINKPWKNLRINQISITQKFNYILVVLLMVELEQQVSSDITASEKTMPSPNLVHLFQQSMLLMRNSLKWQRIKGNIISRNWDRLWGSTKHQWKWNKANGEGRFYALSKPGREEKT